MSAWVVSKAHIDILVTAAIDRAGPGNTFSFYVGDDRNVVTDDNADEIGAMLWAENVKSVNARYEEEDEPLPYTFQRTAEQPIVALLCGIDCYEYQSCEHDEWESSAALAFCDALRRLLIHKLPGYEGAPWGFGEEHRGIAPISLLSLTRGR